MKKNIISQKNILKAFFRGPDMSHKNAVKFKVALIMLLFIAGCNDEFLQRAPLDQVSSETFWNTEADLSLYNLSFYNTTIHDGNNNLADANGRFNPEVSFMFIHAPGGASGWFSPWYMDGASDNMAPIAGTQTSFIDLRSGRTNVPTSPASQRFGYKAWSYIRAVNFGLANYHRANVSEEVRNKYIAEARLFRAWFYADKVQKFGDVPWVDEPLNIDSEELFAARTPREEVMAHVLEDLNFATEHLPDNWGDGNEPGRMNRWCALQVKARIALFEGTWRKYHGGTDPTMWIQVAADASKELIDNGPYSLYTTGNPLSDYNAFHRTVDISGNPEVMYYKKYVSGVGLHGNNMQGYIYSAGYLGGATKDLVEDYLATDGLPITLSDLDQGDQTIEDVFENRDPRLRQTILYPGDYDFLLGDNRAYPRVTGMTGGSISTTGYHVIKFYNPADFKNFSGETPAIILRFAEALLIYAEARAELGVITQNDLDISINKLRDRVGMPHLNLNPPMDPRYADDGISALLVEIRRERRIELAVEGFRYDDLRRWKQGKKLEEKALGLRWDAAAQARYAGANVKTSPDPVTGIQYIDPYKGTDWGSPVFDESKHYLWPIPLNILAENPNIDQNPNW
jgi:hypothetical protein